MGPHLFAAVFATSDSITTLKARGLILIGFVVFLFALAGLAMFLGKRAQKRRHSRELSDLVGVSTPLVFGGDHQQSTTDWWQDATAEDGDARPQDWQQAFLGADTAAYRGGADASTTFALADPAPGGYPAPQAEGAYRPSWGADGEFAGDAWGHQHDGQR